MKLYYSPTSPYSRKTRLAIQFKKIDEQIEQILCNPFKEAPKIKQQNPLGKVPTLLLKDGTAIFDSPVICEYLDSLSTERLLYPKDREEWLKVRRIEALGDGILDAAYNIVMERLRPEGQSSNDCINQWKSEIENSLKYVEKIIGSLTDKVSQAHISMYCTLGYLNFRLPELNWRDNYSEAISKWYDNFQMQYPAIEETKPG